MKPEEFEKCFEGRVELCRQVLIAKGVEYSDHDRLSNFKKASALINDIPEAALWGMAVKHIVSLSDMIQELSININKPMAVWEEKIGDTLNYLFLLRAQLEERKDK